METPHKPTETPPADDYSRLRKILIHEDTIYETYIPKHETAGNTSDSLRLLLRLSEMSLLEATEYVLKQPQGGKYLARRLKFYNRLIHGQITHEQEGWLTNEPIVVPIESTDESVRIGVYREILYSAMQGSPEMAAVKIATKWINEDNPDKKLDSVVALLGYDSGIFSKGLLGQWINLCELYQHCLKSIQTRQPPSQPPTTTKAQTPEHEAVLLTARRLKDAHDYAGKLIISQSPYTPPFWEAIAAGQLGHKVQRQFRGMRLKIQQTDLHNIGRFIGKSGDTKYTADIKQLQTAIQELQHHDPTDPAPRELVSLETNKEKLKLRSKLEKLTRQLVRPTPVTQQSEEEEQLARELAARQYESATASAKADHQKRIAHLSEMTVSDLLAQYEKQLEELKLKSENSKSLAQKALDLHFATNHPDPDEDHQTHTNTVDWINDVPFGTLTRAHKLLVRGAPPERIVAFAACEILLNNQNPTRSDLDNIEEWLKQPHESYLLKGAFKLGPILIHHGYKLSFEQLIDMAGEVTRPSDLGAALDYYKLEELAPVINNHRAMGYLSTVREATLKHGHDFDLDKVIQLASSPNIQGIGAALDNLPFTTVQTLLDKEVSLGMAVIALDISRKSNLALSTDQLVWATRNCQGTYGPNRLHQALTHTTQSDLELLIKANIDLEYHNLVLEIITRSGATRNLTQVLVLENDAVELGYISTLGSLVESYGLKNVETIISAKIPLAEWESVTSSFTDSGLDHYQAFKLGLARASHDRNQCTEALGNHQFPISTRLWLSEAFLPPLDKTLHEATRYFGTSLTELQFQTYKSLSDGDIPPGLAALGVTKSGKEGVRELKHILSNLRRRLMDGTIDVATIVDNPLVNGIVRGLVRFDESEWRGNRTQKFEDVLRSYRGLENEYKPLPSYMTPSDIIPIDKVDKQAHRPIPHETKARYQYLLTQLGEAYSLYESANRPFTTLADQAQPVIEKVVGDLKSSLEHVPNPHAKTSLDEEIKNLQNIDLRDVGNFTRTIKILARHRELNDLLIQTVFVFSLWKNKPLHPQIESFLTQTEPTVDSLSFMVNFVDHITNKETLKKYFRDRDSYNAFARLINIQSLVDEIAKNQNQASIGTVKMQFVPCRNLLTEYSGDIADSCWTGKYASILRKFPNFSSVIFVQNPESIDEKYVGAALLIETESDAGTPLLVIRGTNPLENTINSLSIPDFFDKFTAYCRSLAHKDGRKLAIVIDAASGRAGTNRPRLYTFLSQLPRTAVRLKSPDDTTFNGYNIVNDCILLE